MSSKEKMLRVRQLIEEKKYHEAQKILRTINHPRAQEWLEKLDQRIEMEKPSSKLRVGISSRSAIAISVIAVILVLGFAAILLLVDSNGKPELPITETAFIEASPAPSTLSQTPTAQWAYSNTLSNPLSATSPIIYDAGTLEILSVHSPVGAALYSTESYAPLTNNNEFVGIEFAFQCASICDAPPEAELSLALHDGTGLDPSPVFSLQKSTTVSDNSHVEWLYFHVQNPSAIAALHITNDDTSLFVSLPSPTNGYFVSTSLEYSDDGGQKLQIPKLRRLLDKQYAVDDIAISTSNNVTGIFVPIVLDTLYFENDQQVIDATFPIITTLSREWDDYSESVDALVILLTRVTDRKSTATVIAGSRTLTEYLNRNLSSNELINSLSVEIQEYPPTLSNPQSTEVPPITNTPSTVATNSVAHEASAPTTGEEFEQYLWANYSSIGGQPLSITRIDISSEPPIVSIVLAYELDGWQLFTSQTNAVATEYAERLTSDVKAFFGTASDMLVTVSYSYYTDHLEDFHYDDEWWYIGDYDVSRGWYVSKDLVSAFFYNGSWSMDIWNYK